MKQTNLLVEPHSTEPEPVSGLRTVGLFSGIGGLERGLEAAGHRSVLLCENEPGAQAVLRARVPRVELVSDVRDIERPPEGTELLAGGFPCQDLSQAGATTGIGGDRSSLVGEALRIAEAGNVPWLLLENVPFMLQLNRGEALEHIIGELERLGYQWAYRVLDSRFTGVPQRRRRVFFLASLTHDPRHVLLSSDVGEQPEPGKEGWRERACGFYWTEGLRGLGWAYDSVPTLKCGSTLGIPSPPAIVLESGEVVKPDVRDAERLQGFPADWTEPSEDVVRKSHRWKLVGNAVTVDVARWIGEKLVQPEAYDHSLDEPLPVGSRWPDAAWGRDGERFRSFASAWPRAVEGPSLEEFLEHPTIPLSARATAGFLNRASRAKLRFPPGFLDLMEEHLGRMQVGT